MSRLLCQKMQQVVAIRVCVKLRRIAWGMLEKLRFSDHFDEQPYIFRNQNF